jgi:hypothetical protein
MSYFFFLVPGAGSIGRLDLGKLLFKFGNFGNQPLDSLDFHFHTGSDQKTERNQHEDDRTDATENLSVIEDGIEKSRDSHEKQNGAPCQHDSSLAAMAFNIMSTVREPFLRRQIKKIDKNTPGDYVKRLIYKEVHNQPGQY